MSIVSRYIKAWMLFLLAGSCLFSMTVKGVLVFDGSNDYVIVKRDLTGGAAGTICDISGQGNNGTPLGVPVYWSPEDEIAQCQKTRD